MTNSVLSYEPPKPASAGRQAFGVIVRTVGLLIALWGVYALVYGLGETRIQLPSRYPPATTMIFGIIYLVIGAALIRGE